MDDGSGDGHEPWNPARSWWARAVTGVGLIGAGVVLGWALGSRSGPSDDATGAAPAVVSTTSATTSATQSNTTTTMPITTTTEWWGATDEAALLHVQILNVCERATPAGADGLQMPEEWAESLFIDDDWMYYYLERQIASVMQAARLAQDARLVGLLELVDYHIGNADTATDDILHSIDIWGSDEWMNMVALAERPCAAAAGTIATMMAMSSQ